MTIRPLPATPRLIYPLSSPTALLAKSLLAKKLPATGLLTKRPLGTLPLVCLILTATLLAPLRPAAAVTVSSIQDPRPNSWVVDRTRTLSSSNKERLNEVAERVHLEGGEIVFVMVDRLSGAQPRRFATELGNRWDLNPQGVLVLVAKKDRKSEIILGKRVDSASQVRQSRKIMDEILVPRFRSGRYGEGLVAGAEAIERDILDLSPAAAAHSTPSRTPAPAGTGTGNPFVEAPETLAISSNSRSEPVVSPEESYKSPLWNLLGKAMGLLLALGAAIKGAIWALKPPHCTACQVQRIKLGEVEEDAHLSAPERLEETLDTVDYRLWACPSCGDVLKRKHKRWFRNHKGCPSCGFVTMSRVKTVLEKATSHSSGLAEIVEDCTHCDHHSVTQRTIPRHSDSSSSFGSSSGSFGSSSGGSFSSGSGSSGSW